MACGYHASAMSVLTRDVILRDLDEGRIQIDPFDRSQIGVASIDLTLGREIREIINDDEPIRVEDATDYRDHTRVRDLHAPYRLEPGVTIHGITAEHVSLPDDLCGFLEGRSRFARLGLMIHVTSAFVQPGVSNRQVLEMSNVSSRALEIVPGVRVCQLVLMRTEGRAVYSGRFKDQREI
jgi:dCTP deaminase